MNSLFVRSNLRRYNNVISSTKYLSNYMSSKYRVTATEDCNEPTTSNILKNSFGSYHLGSFHSNNVSSRINLLTLNNACVFGQNISHRNYSSSTVPEVKESVSKNCLVYFFKLVQ